MKKNLPITLMLLLLLAFASPAQAWWIFGDSGPAEAMLQGVTINSIPYEGSPRQLLFYPEFLTNSQLTIKGKAVSEGRPAQSLSISLNTRETWENVTLNPDGSFSYSFRPAAGAEYGIYLKAEANGKTNDIQRSGKLVRISAQPLQAAASDVITRLLAAYKEENIRLFMSYVSPNFAGDDILLARAVRRDFSALDNIDVRYTINSIAVDQKGKVAVTLKYNRTAVVTRKSASEPNPIINDSGTTQMVFTLGENGLKLYSMKMPLLFGLSDANNVASGEIRSSDNSKVLGITHKGEGFSGTLQQIKDDKPYHSGPHYPGGGGSPPTGGI